MLAPLQQLSAFTDAACNCAPIIAGFIPHGPTCSGEVWLNGVFLRPISKPASRHNLLQKNVVVDMVRVSKVERAGSSTHGVVAFRLYKGQCVDMPPNNDSESRVVG